MTAAVKLAVTPSSEAIAMTGPVGRPHQAQRPSPAQLECNHACARIAASLSSIVGGRREGGGPRKRRLDHPSSAAGGTRCTAVMARFLGGGDRSIRAPLVAGRRAPAAIAPRNFSSTLALTAFGGRRTSRKTLRSFPSLSECYGRKGSEADLEREALAAGCSQSCRCSRITSASPQRQMLQWSRRRSLSHGCRLGRMAIGRGRSAGERRLVAVAFKQSPEGEGENQHEQGGKSPPAPPSMFSVKQLLLGAGKGGEAQLMAASSGDAGERSVDVGLGPGADRVVVSLDLCVTGVFVGYPGSWHDIQVIQLSSLWTRAEEGDLFHGPAVLPLFGV